MSRTEIYTVGGEVPDILFLFHTNVYEKGDSIWFLNQILPPKRRLYDDPRDGLCV